MTGFEAIVLVLLIVIAWIAWKTYKTISTLMSAMLKTMSDQESANDKRWEYFYLNAFANLTDIHAQLEHIDLMVADWHTDDLTDPMQKEIARDKTP